MLAPVICIITGPTFNFPGDGIWDAADSSSSILLLHILQTYELSCPPTHELLKKLEPPQGKVPMILDTDTYNEVDDQFAIAHALFSPDQVDLLAV